MKVSCVILILVLFYGSYSLALLPVYGARSAPYLLAPVITVVKGVSFIEANAKSNSTRKIDFAELEYRYPLDKKSLRDWTSADLKILSSEKIDQLYARLDSGPSPQGQYSSAILFRPDKGIDKLVNELLVAGPIAKAKAAFIESFSSLVWRGKVFDPSTPHGTKPDSRQPFQPRPYKERCMGSHAQVP